MRSVRVVGTTGRPYQRDDAHSRRLPATAGAMGVAMNDEGRRCALPGCDVEIQIAYGRPERRYCTAVHRAAARKARRAASHAQLRSEPAPDLAETLPWLRGPGESTGDAA